jgi:uncharacterized membrane protein YkoI
MKFTPLALALLALGSGAAATAPALAQMVAQPAHTDDVWAKFTGGPDALPRAIARIEADTGGQVLEIRFIDKDGEPGVAAAVLKSGQVSFLRAAMDAGNEIALTDADVPVSLMSWRSRRDVHLARRAPVSLDQAIRTAEQAQGGRPAVAAGLARSASNTDSDVHAYNILVADGGRTHRVAVDSETGQIIGNPSALNDWP